MSKFENVGNDPDTKILFSTPTTYGDYDVLYQKWKFDGITAESLIFLTDDIKDITKSYLMNDIGKSPLVNDSSKEITTSDKDQFTFFNFNFVIGEDND